MDHVAIDQASATINGGVHLGPGKEQADFPANEVGRRSEELNQTHSSSSAIGNVARGGNDLVQSSHSGEVSVQSSVVMDTTQQVNTQGPAQIQKLLSRLSSTTAQVDDYSRRQNEAISKEANERVQKIIAHTQLEQEALLRDASSRSLEIEAEYAAQLKAFLQGLDASKAGNLAALEKDLNFRQEQLLDNARAEMDDIHAAATRAKIAAMTQADAAMHSDVDRLTEQVKALGEAEVERRMNSTTTTVITTHTSTDSQAQVAGLDKTVDVTTTSKDIRTATATEPRANVRV